MFGPRLVSAALLILLLAGLVGAALITRYRYYDSQGVPMFRIDRWTGVREQWYCRKFKTDESGKILREWTDADETYAIRQHPAPFATQKTVCAWYAD